MFGRYRFDNPPRIALLSITMPEEKNPRTPLPARQERFAVGYALTGNGAKAAREAGYAVERAKVTGSELVAKGNVWARIAEEREAAFRELGLQVQDIIRGVLSEARNPDATPDARIRAWRTLGEWRGLASGMGRDGAVDARSIAVYVQTPEEARALLTLGLEALEGEGRQTPSGAPGE